MSHSRPSSTTLRHIALAAGAGIAVGFIIYHLLSKAHVASSAPTTRPTPDSIHIQAIPNPGGTYSCVFHGGAGTISKRIDPTEFVAALSRICEEAESLCSSGELGAVDVATAVVSLLEDCPLFNAGKGSVYTSEGKHEMEASVMDGSTLRGGAVAMITRARHPIRLARHVMDNTKHRFLVGEHIQQMAERDGFEMKDNTWFDTEIRLKQLKATQSRDTTSLSEDIFSKIRDDNAKGTVGCVVCINGNVAAATSTGGMTNKLPGRIGDSPGNGIGNYANNDTCAVSGTGTGEEFMKHVAAYSVHRNLERLNDTHGRVGVENLNEACLRTVEHFSVDTGGFIAVDCQANISIVFNSTGMFRGFVNSRGDKGIAIWREVFGV